jgi:hypothetical protein
MMFFRTRQPELDPNVVSVTPPTVTVADWGEPRLRLLDVGVPDETVGEEGDFYFDVGDVAPNGVPALYGPKGADGTWPGPLVFDEEFYVAFDGAAPTSGDVDGPDVWVQLDPGGALVWGPRQTVGTPGQLEDQDGIVYDASQGRWVASNELVLVNRDGEGGGGEFEWLQFAAYPSEEGFGDIYYGNEPPTSGSPGQDFDWFWYDDGNEDIGLYLKLDGEWQGPLPFASGSEPPTDPGEEPGQAFIVFVNFPATEDGDISAIYEWQEVGQNGGGIGDGDAVVWNEQQNRWVVTSQSSIIQPAVDAVDNLFDAVQARIPTVKSSFYIEDNATATDVSQNVAAKVAGTFLSGPTCSSCTVDGNRITYNGDRPTRVLASASVDLDAPDGNQTYLIEVRRNGDAVAGARCKIRRFNSMANGSLVAFIDLEPDDYVELWVTNVTSGSDPTIIDATVALIN